ncbi:hypothetical protein DPEC_G00344600 [Dallia pectoralis]|uniref:Uncharacterized protein n=1 Tax=Dallia pectoralis TaxID=75939 RepID=A0ACC2F3F3_DALPE|nr:hypothetical protein DPEC_G00344600 [Dallia pectoralis]
MNSMLFYYSKSLLVLIAAKAVKITVTAREHSCQ